MQKYGYKVTGTICRNEIDTNCVLKDNIKNSGEFVHIHWFANKGGSANKSGFANETKSTHETDFVVKNEFAYKRGFARM